MSKNTQIPRQINKPDLWATECLSKLQAQLMDQDISCDLPQLRCRLREIILSSDSIDELRFELECEYGWLARFMADGILEAIEALDIRVASEGVLVTFSALDGPPLEFMPPFNFGRVSAIEFMIIRLDDILAATKSACREARRVKSAATKFGKLYRLKFTTS